jgi:glycosyltransferase involved in cell wall biosynthesis
MSEPLFSVVLISRNESKTLPRMVASLKDFRERGGEVILVDTGSSDGTAEIAETLGCKVHRVGERFLTILSKKQADAINKQFVKGGEEKVVAEGDRIFDYSSARNFAASLAKNNVVAMPDCDEIYTALDIDAINENILSGVEQLEYDFVYAHDEQGREAVKFRHCKFYDRRKLHWVGIIHEILAGSAERQYFSPAVIKLEHWQQPNENRGRYLAGLALDCFSHPENDRNSHYFAREMMYKGRFRSAIAEFKRHVTLNGWVAERAQSFIFMGDCHTYLGEKNEAILCYQQAINLDGDRREGWMKLADLYWRSSDLQRAASYAHAAVSIPWRDFYANRMSHYREEPHKILYHCFWWLGDRQKSFEHWKLAEGFAPEDKKIREDSKFYLDFLNPKVSVVIPTLCRPEAVEALEQSIPELAKWDNLEIVVEQDSLDNRRGAPKTLKAGVDRSTGDFVLFLGDDCRPTAGFVRIALECAFKNFRDGFGLVGLNDGIWKGEIATHWLASKALLPMLDGEFFHTGYHHVGCDNELTARCKKLGKFAWCEESRIEHDHPAKKGWDNLDESHRLAYSRVVQDRQLLKERAEQLGFVKTLVP